MKRISQCWAVCVLAAVAGCEDSVLVPLEMLDVTLTPSSSIVAPGEAFSATLTVFNPTNEDTEVVTANGCLSDATVHRDDEPQYWKGARQLCTDAITHHVIPAGESVKWDFELEALSRESSTSWDEWAEAEPGTYMLGVTTFPAVEVVLEVRR